jgi:hypothetical protein
MCTMVYIVACRAITRQRLQDKQIYQSHYWVTLANTNKHVSNKSTCNSRGTVRNSVFYSGLCRGVISGTKWRGECGIYARQQGRKWTVLKPITRKWLMKIIHDTLQWWNWHCIVLTDFVSICAVVLYTRFLVSCPCLTKLQVFMVNRDEP